ncbi:(Fe-S)-binding protein [Desulfosarcina cetonica]|uniref:(Fe-S)-binding protein n=1 Tax=Desulfosarcina cetonica TaxID=90730 RepID=UPI001FF004DD|nr:(Fe-S)-binding protein [Desulfosarcina cetonica]
MPGCSANAEAIVAGKASPNSCVAAGDEVALAIAEILGVSVEAKEPDIALPGCTYGVADAAVKYKYDGLNDCRAAALLSGGMKVCNIGCLGLGTCAAACPFGALPWGPRACRWSMRSSVPAAGPVSGSAPSTSSPCRR